MSSVAFGGPDFGELFITTAAVDLPADRPARQPLAGSVFRYRPGVAGVPPATFAG